MNKTDIIAARDIFQSLLDNYQITGTALEPFKNAMVLLNSGIDTPDSEPEAPAPAPAPTPAPSTTAAQPAAPAAQAAA